MHRYISLTVIVQAKEKQKILETEIKFCNIFYLFNEANLIARPRYHNCIMHNLTTLKNLVSRKFVMCRNGHDSQISQLLISRTLVSLSLSYINPITLRKAKTVYNFGLSECNRVKECSLDRGPVVFVFLYILTLTFLNKLLVSQSKILEPENLL